MFKIGDRVRVKQKDPRRKKGLEGEVGVVERGPSQDNLVWLSFDKYPATKTTQLPYNVKELELEAGI